MKKFISIIVTFSIILTMLPALDVAAFSSELKNVWGRDESIDFSTIPEIKPGAEQTVELGEAGKICVYKFTPAEDGAYKYYSDGSWSYFGAIHDSSYRTVKEGNNIIIEYGRPSLSGDFGIIYSFKAGETYYLESYIDYYESGTYKVGLEKVPKATAMDIRLIGYKEYGSTLEFSPVFTPVDCEPEIISWSSSNPEVIEINNDGTAFCKGIGTATITAETQSGLIAERELVIEDCEELTIGEKKRFMVLFDIREMYKIVPEVSGTYSFDYEMGDFVWYISSTLYDKDLNVIGKKASDEAGKEFDLVAGNEYYLEIESNSGDVMTDASVLVNLKGAPVVVPTDTPIETATPEPVITEIPTATATILPLETCTIPPTPYPEITDNPLETYDLGDISMDETVNAEDALLVLKHAAKLVELNERHVELGDVSRGGMADAKDALYILQYAAHIISSFDEIVEPSDPTPKPTKVPSGYEIFDSIDVNYDNTRVFSTTGSANEPYIGLDLPDIRVISDYAEYKEYIANANKQLNSVNDNLEINIYSEEFFIDNSVVVIDYDIGDYSTEVYFSDIEQVEGKYKVNIEHHSSFMQLPMLRHWEIMIPIAGKECTAEEFEVNFINECKWYCIENDCGKAAPIVSESGQEYPEYPLVLSTYEEYQEYMDLFKEANPNYEVNLEYTEEDFESMKLVVGGFWTFSGQLDLKYSGIRTRDDEFIIDFDGTCPSPYTEDSYYYHFMVACDILDVSQYDVRWNIDVEYYE